MKPFSIGTIQRLLREKSARNEKGCWIWMGSMDSKGYGRMMRNGIMHSASRMSLHVFKGFPLESNLDACHNDKVCDSRACVNPDHLYAGSRARNISDSVIRGTHRSGFKRKTK